MPAILGQHARAPLVDDVRAIRVKARLRETRVTPRRTLFGVKEAKLETIDPALLDAAWPGPISASKKTDKGIGLVWRLLDTGEAIYARKLTVAEVQARIAKCYSPYHKALRDSINAAHKHYGAVWHINCHSMPAMSSVICNK